MRALMLMLGLPNLSTPQLVVFLAIIAVMVLLFGWLSDLLLGDGGFGVAINSAVGLTGAILGALLWRKLGLTIGTNPAMTTSFIALGAGLVLLIMLTTIRRWL